MMDWTVLSLGSESVILEGILAKCNLYKVLRPVKTKNATPGVDGLKLRIEEVTEGTSGYSGVSRLLTVLSSPSR